VARSLDRTAAHHRTGDPLGLGNPTWESGRSSTALQRPGSNLNSSQGSAPTPTAAAAPSPLTPAATVTSTAVLATHRRTGRGIDAIRTATATAASAATTNIALASEAGVAKLDRDVTASTPWAIAKPATTM